VVTPEVNDRIMQQIIWPTVQGMAAEGNDYVGFLYAGLMISPEGEPRVIEYNCRFGDPETQPIMLRMKSDLVELCLAATKGELDQHYSDWDERAALGVVLAAGGYPDAYEKGLEILGLDEAFGADSKVFHAGTTLSAGKILTNGGRVLCATALGSSVSEAQRKAYALTSQICWQGMFFRKDIGYQAIAREETG
jgi:phosphoribosylamine--glycine ligase